MKRYTPLLASLSLLLAAGCFPTRIVTTSPYTEVQRTYTTTVAEPRTKTVITSSCAVSAADDISLYLDLQAVGAAFAQSSSIQDFEFLLNNSSYMLSNLDLNRDGYVDYLRVMESREGYNHVYVIQACLAPGIFQDVATLVAEVHSSTRYFVEVIGSPYIYGKSYIVRPVFVGVPPIFAHLYRTSYTTWASPWYWNHFPSCYRRPAPILLSHYQAYVNTYMRDHRYCHGFEYANSYHYPDYGRVCAGICRNDYANQYPDRAFTVRTANIPANNGRNNGRVVNARDIFETRGSATSTRTTTTPTRRAATAAATSAVTSARESSSAAARETTAAREAAARQSSSRGSSSSISRSASSSSAPRTTVQSRVSRSGSSSTSISTTNDSGTTTTSSRTASSSSSSARSSSSSSSRTSSDGSSSSARSGSSSARSGSSSARSGSSSSRR